MISVQTLNVQIILTLQKMYNNAELLQIVLCGNIFSQHLHLMTNEYISCGVSK